MCFSSNDGSKKRTRCSGAALPLYLQAQTCLGQGPLDGLQNHRPPPGRKALRVVLVFRISWRPWKWNSVAHVGKPSDVSDSALEPEPESGMRNGAVSA